MVITLDLYVQQNAPTQKDEYHMFSVIFYKCMPWKEKGDCEETKRFLRSINCGTQGQWTIYVIETLITIW